MASLYKRKGSPFWWIKWRDPHRPIFADNGPEIPRRQSTCLKIGVGPDTRAAQSLVAKRTAAERESLHLSANEERWETWVEPWLESRYSITPQTLIRFRAAWRTVRMFLAERDLRVPRQFTRKHCDDYMAWRSKPNKRQGKYRAGHNTALLELKFIGMLLKEAVIRNFAPANPVRELGIHRAAAKQPCDFSGERCQVKLEDIAAAIAKEPEPKRTMLSRSFLIARYHGVRLNETRVNPSADVRLWTKANIIVGEITFHQKGRQGKKRIRTKPLHPRLVELFQPLCAAGATEVFPTPKSFAKEWHNFFIRWGFKAKEPNCCFHSLRVTVENMLRRARVPREIRKQYLTHESKADVNEMYDRVDIDEMRACHAALDV